MGIIFYYWYTNLSSFYFMVYYKTIGPFIVYGFIIKPLDPLFISLPLTFFVWTINNVLLIVCIATTLINLYEFIQEALSGSYLWLTASFSRPLLLFLYDLVLYLCMSATAPRVGSLLLPLV